MMRSFAWSLLLAFVMLGCDASDGDGHADDEGSSSGRDAAADAGDDDGDSAGRDAGSARADGGSGDRPPRMHPEMAMDECGLDTGYEGDEYCILPPPPDKGFQLHIGPSNYENPEPEYVLEPGEESTDDFGAIAGNESDIYFLYRQFRMRPGSHHMIVYHVNGSGAAIGETLGGRRIGTANASLDSPVGGVIAPENQGVGIPLPAQAELNVSLHSITVGDMPIIREVWVNFWYRDPDEVTESAEQLFAIGDPTFTIQPGEDTMLGPYSCDIQAEGRMLWFYGHRHANNKRFSAWRVRGDQRDLFYEGYHWEEPLLLEYTSLIENPAPNREAGIEGGWSGILDLQPGDRLEWECHVVNEQATPLRFTNNTYTGEMCIMDAEIVGTNCVSSFRFGAGAP